METKTATKKTPAKKSAPTKNAAKSNAKTPTKAISKTSTKATSKTPAKKNAAKELKDLFEDSLKDIYWAEKALLKALPTMMKNATHEKLKKAIENHIVETEGHVERLEECFKALGKKAQAKKCDISNTIRLIIF